MVSGKILFKKKQQCSVLIKTCRSLRAFIIIISDNSEEVSTHLYYKWGLECVLANRIELLLSQAHKGTQVIK